GGHAGTATAGGDPGAGGAGATDGSSGAAGTIGAGGGGGAVGAGGGGGGGGYYGGGGGGGGAYSFPHEAASGGGGGGSSSAPGGSTGTVAPGTPASVTISYAVVLPPGPEPVPTPPQPPTVRITKPVNGARYVRGQKIVVAYSCAPALGNTLRSCTGPVASGAQLTASKTGPHLFKVTATSTDGLSTSQTVSYRVVAPKKKTGITATVTIDYGDKLMLDGTLVGSLGSPKLELPFTPCKTVFVTCKSSDATFRLRARPSKKKLAIMALELKRKTANSGKVNVKVGSGSSAVSLTYTLGSPWISKFETRGRDRLITIHYKKLSVGMCKPADSC
ncbi:MAG: hypothetical protein JWN32_4448, partial [Solirubrobacterales bacterium]|nr:hypothetical protein [Solirubrobacterales bacterium]